MGKIYRGSDLAGVQIQIADDAGEPMDFSTMTSIKIELMDDFFIAKAQYIYPYTGQQGFTELRAPQAGLLEFDIHKEDSQFFSIGRLYANITFNSPEDNFPDGYQPEIRNILIGKVDII